MTRQIDVSVDVFAAIWSARLPNETSEDEILRRLLKVEASQGSSVMHPNAAAVPSETEKNSDVKMKSHSKPDSKQWVDVLVWALSELGGRAHLSAIYEKTMQGRRALGVRITAQHDASARECLESHCRESSKFRGHELFWMPEGKGAGVWALCVLK